MGFETISDWYKKEEANLKKKHMKEYQDLRDLLEKKQKTCKHKWEFVKDLFYALGRTCDGEKCLLCEQQRHIR